MQSSYLYSLVPVVSMVLSSRLASSWDGQQVRERRGAYWEDILSTALTDSSVLCCVTETKNFILKLKLAADFSTIWDQFSSNLPFSSGTTSGGTTYNMIFGLILTESNTFDIAKLKLADSSNLKVELNLEGPHASSLAAQTPLLIPHCFLLWSWGNRR